MNPNMKSNMKDKELFSALAPSWNIQKNLILSSMSSLTSLEPWLNWSRKTLNKELMRLIYRKTKMDKMEMIKTMRKMKISIISMLAHKAKTMLSFGKSNTTTTMKALWCPWMKFNFSKLQSNKCNQSKMPSTMKWFKSYLQLTWPNLIR